MQSWVLEPHVRDLLTQLLHLWWEKFRSLNEPTFKLGPNEKFENYHMDRLWTYINLKHRRLPVDTLLVLLPQLKTHHIFEQHIRANLDELGKQNQGFIPVQWSFSLSPEGEILATGRLLRT